MRLTVQNAPSSENKQVEATFLSKKEKFTQTQLSVKLYLYLSKKRHKKKDQDEHNSRFTIVTKCVYMLTLQKTGSAKIPRRVQHKPFIFRCLNKINLMHKDMRAAVGIKIKVQTKGGKTRKKGNQSCLNARLSPPQKIFLAICLCTREK